MSTPKQEHKGRLENDYGDPRGYVPETDSTKVIGDDSILFVGSDANSDYVTNTLSAITLPQNVGNKAINNCSISIVPYAGSDNDYVGLTEHSASSWMTHMLP